MSLHKPNLDIAHRFSRIEQLENRRLLAITPQIVKDIELYEDVLSADVGNITDVNGTAFFAATTYTTGRELWRSDGTELGTYLVKDIFPGKDSSYPSGINVNGTFYFAADDGTSDFPLWRSDGTIEGTRRIKNADTQAFPCQVWNLTNVAGTLFFQAICPGEELALWKSDGTDGGTVRVRVTNSSNVVPPSPDSVEAVGPTLYFVSEDSSIGRELWKSDGTQFGTIVVSDVMPGSYGSDPRYLTNLNGKLFFSAHYSIFGRRDVGGRELFVSDGTGFGTHTVKEIAAGRAGANVKHLTAVGDWLYFSADDGSGDELWKSNGTELGTVLFRLCRRNRR